MSDPFESLFGQPKGEILTEEETIQKYLSETHNGESSTAKKFKLDIFKTLRAIDNKDRNYYDNLTDEEKKGFAPFVLNRWLSSVDSNMPELVEWWLRATDENFNMHLLNLNSAEMKHPKLQWLMATACSPGMGVMKHQWVGYKKKTGKAVNNKVKKFLMDQYPTFKEEDVLLLMTLITNKEIRAYAKELGMVDKEIKKII